MYEKDTIADTLKNVYSYGNHNYSSQQVAVTGSTVIYIYIYIYIYILPDQWKESIIVSIHKKGDETDCNNYRGISLLSTSYKMLSNILLSRLVLYVDEIIGDHRCGFRHNRSTTDQIFCIRRILEKIWEYNETVHQLFIDFKKAYESVRREVLYNILTEFGVPMKLVRLIKMCSNEPYSKVHIT
jgi:hypothetical protein